MHKISTPLLGLFCLILLLFPACMRKALVINEFSDDDCPISDSSGYYDSLLVASVQKLNLDTTACSTRLPQRFSNRAIHIAENLGVKSLLCELQRLEENKGSDIDILKIKSELQGRINTGVADVASCLSEMECQIVRTRELQKHLEDWISARLNRANAYSILAGSITTIASSLVAVNAIKITTENDASNIVAQTTVIVGAIIGTYYGFRAMTIHRKVLYNHPRNYIAAIYEKKNDNGVFSPFLWKFMNKPFNKAGKQINGIEDVLHKWHGLGIPTDAAEDNYKEKVGLFTSLGGEYEVDDLDNRIEMFDILREEISLINYDLKRLQQEILIGKK